MIVKIPALIHKALFFSKITKSMRAMRAIYENIVSDKEGKYQAVAWPAINKVSYITVRKITNKAISFCILR